MPTLPTRPLYNRSRKNHEPLQVYGYILSEKEMVDWLRWDEKRNIRGHDSDYEEEAIEKIAERLRASNELDYSWTAVRNPVDNELTSCFYVGSNHNKATLKRAKNWKRIRRYQRVLGIEEDVLPCWYKVVAA